MKRVDRLLKLAALLESGRKPRGVDFDYRITYSDGGGRPRTVPDGRKKKGECGAVGCVIGWACCFFGKVGSPINAATASEILGLDEFKANRLFFDHDLYVGGGKRFVDITVNDAAKACRRMAAEAL